MNRHHIPISLTSSAKLGAFSWVVSSLIIVLGDVDSSHWSVCLSGLKPSPTRHVLTWRFTQLGSRRTSS